MIYDYLLRAALVGILLAVLLSIMSYFVVLRKMTSAGVGIAHSAFGGIALNFLFGIRSYVLPLSFSIIASIFIAFMYKRGKMSEDSAIDLIFVFSMAFGVFIMSISKGYSANILGILFGNILAVNTYDLYTSIFIFILGFLFLNIFFSHFQLITYNEELAKVSGMNVDLLYYLFWIILAVTIVLSIKLIGIILVNAFLVLPALVGMNMSKNYKSAIFSAIASSVVSMLLGIFISYLVNAPTGASIVLTFVTLWALSAVYAKLK